MSTPLQMIDRSLTLRKPVDALVLVPTNNRLSPLGRKLYNVLLYVAQTNLRNMDGIPPATYMFSAPLLDLLRVCNAEQSFSTAKQYLQEMRESSVVWDSPDSNAELQHKGFQLVTIANDAGLIHRFSPDGRLDRSLAVPVKKPTMCAFGGPNLDTLFVTSIRPAGDLSDQPLAGGVFALQPGAKGLEETCFNN